MALEKAGVVTEVERGKIKFRYGFVGMVVSMCGIIHVLPKHYAVLVEDANKYHGRTTIPPARDPPEAYAKLFSQAVLRYIRGVKPDVRNEQFSQFGDAPMLVRAYDLLQAHFARFGVFRERKLSETDSGKVHWSKTVARNEALFSASGGGGSYSVLYHNPTHERTVDVDSRVSDVFKVTLRVALADGSKIELEYGC